MTELIMDWLRVDVQLPVSLAHFEEGFANGFMFGELFKAFRQLPKDEEFLDDHTIEAKLHNFKKLQPVLKSLGVKCTTARVQEIMAARRGAALRVLYQVKMALENVAPPLEHTKQDDKPELFQSVRIPREDFDSHDERFFDGRIRAVAYRESDRALAWKLQKFHDEAALQESNARELDRIDEERGLAQRDRNRQIILEKAQQNRNFLDEWQRRGQQTWAVNLQHQWTREAAELRFEKKSILRKHRHIREIREAASSEVAEIAKFEENLQKLGGSCGPADYQTDQEHDAAVREMVQKATLAETSEDLQQHFSRTCPTATQMDADADAYLQKHKMSSYAGQLARQERECRRRKYLVDMHREQTNVEDRHVEDAIMRKIMREALEEKRLAYQVWKTSRMEDVMRLNRSNRSKHYKTRKKAMNQRAVICDQMIANQELEHQVTQIDKEARRYRNLERGRLARANGRLADDCEKIIGLLVDLAEVAFSCRELTDVKDPVMDPRLWEQCLHAFVDGKSAHAQTVTAADSAPFAVPGKPGDVLEEHPLEYTRTSFLPPATAAERLLLAGRQTRQEAQGSIQEWSLDDYLAAGGPWEQFRPDSLDSLVPPIDEELPFAPVLEVPPLVDGKPRDYRLGNIVKQLLSRSFPQPLPPPPPQMPRVPIRLIITGKPHSGKATLARRLEESYNLRTIYMDELIKECMALAGRPEADPLALTMTEVALNRDEDYGPDLDPYAHQLRELGHQMCAVFDRGEDLADQTLVDAVVNKIRSLFHERNFPPDQDGEPPNGWILVGFPRTAAQYALLERALSGYCCPTLQPPTELDGRLASAQRLVPPAPAPEDMPTRTPGGADYHFVLDVPNDELARRVVGRRRDPVTDLQYHLEDAPPYPVHAIPTSEQKLTATFSSMPAFWKQKQVVFERLELVDELSAAVGTVTDRLHVFDANQLEIAEFAEFLGTSSPDMARLVSIPDATPDRIYDVADELTADLLEKWERQEPHVSLPEVPGARDHDFDPPEEKAASQGGGAATPKESPTGSQAAASAPKESPTGSQADPAEPLEPPRLLEIAELDAKVFEIEDRVVKVLTDSWLTIETSTISQLKEVFIWLRNARISFVAGKAEMQTRYLARIQQPSAMQDDVEELLDAINRFTDEYPAMRPHDATKAELHARTADLADKLEEQVCGREAVAEESREEFMASGWTESQDFILATMLQRLVQVELMAFQSMRNMVVDFYTAASGELMPELPPELSRVDAFEMEVPKAEEVVDDKKKPPPKGKQEVVEEDVKEEGPPKPRLVTEPQYDPDDPSVLVVPSEVQYPFLDLVFGKANEHMADIMKPLPWIPGGEEKEEEEEKVDDKKKPPPKGKGKEVEEEKPVEVVPTKPMPHAWVDLNQALRNLHISCAFRLEMLQKWGRTRLDEMAQDGADFWRSLRAQALAEHRAERQAIDALKEQICEHIEQEEKIPCLLSVGVNKLRTHPNVLLDPPPVPRVPALQETPVEGRATLAQLASALDMGRALARGGQLRATVVREMRAALGPGRCRTTSTRGDHAAAREVLLSLALARDEDWPDLAELIAARDAVGGMQAELTEESFAALPLFERSFADPSGFARPRLFKQWLFRVFEAFPFAPGPITAGQVLGLLSLSWNVGDSLRASFALHAVPSGSIGLEELHEGFHRHVRGSATMAIEDVVHRFRELITDAKLGKPLVMQPVRETPTTEESLIKGWLEGGLESILGHPGMDGFPLVAEWTRPGF